MQPGTLHCNEVRQQNGKTYGYCTYVGRVGTHQYHYRIACGEEEPKWLGLGIDRWIFLCSRPHRIGIHTIPLSELQETVDKAGVEREEVPAMRLGGSDGLN